MPDSSTIAVVSIACSTGVATVALVSQSWNARAGRLHERRLALDERSWQALSSALTDAMTFASGLNSIISDWEGTADVVGLLPAIRASKSKLDGPLLAPLQLYGSQVLISSLRYVKSALASVDLEDIDTWEKMQNARIAKNHCLNQQDFAGAADARHQEVTHLEQLGYFASSGQHRLPEILERFIVELRAEAQSEKKQRRIINYLRPSVVRSRVKFWYEARKDMRVMRDIREQADGN